MPSLSSRPLRLLTHTALLSLCAALPACVDDVVVMPPGQNPPPGADAGAGPDAYVPPDPQQAIYYDLATFANDIQPQLDQGCTLSGCHSEQDRFTPFFLVRTPGVGSTAMWSNLLRVTDLVDLAVTPFVAEDTLLYRRSTDNHAGTVFSNATALRDWLNEAAASFPDRTGVWDPDAFELDIQPTLDQAGCSRVGCHDYESGREFLLFPAPERRSGKMAQNMRAVMAFTDLGEPGPEDTDIYLRATDGHGGTPITSEQAAALAAWIQDAMTAVFE